MKSHYGRVLAAFGTVIGLPAIAILFGYYLYGSLTCKAYGNSTERPVRYNILVGCLVKVEGKSNYTPRSEIRTQE